MYPIGSLYITINPNFDPNVTFGGTWVAIENAIYIKSSTNNQDIGDITGDNTKDINHIHAIPFFTESKNTTNFASKQPWNYDNPTNDGVSTVPNHYTISKTPVASTTSGYFMNTYYAKGAYSSDIPAGASTMNIEPRHIKARIWKRTA